MTGDRVESTHFGSSMPITGKVFYRKPYSLSRSKVLAVKGGLVAVEVERFDRRNVWVFEDFERLTLAEFEDEHFDDRPLE